jgi:hypothetical protein
MPPNRFLYNVNTFSHGSCDYIAIWGYMHPGLPGVLRRFETALLTPGPIKGISKGYLGAAVMAVI